MEVTLDGETLIARRDPRSCWRRSDGLALIRGKWVEVDRERLGRTLEQFEAVERRAAAEGLSFAEAMRLLAGAGIADEAAAAQADVDWSETVAGPWLAETLAALRRPDGLAARRSRAGAARHAAALPAGGRALAAPAGAARARRLPRRRHGPRQDHPGARRCCWC